MDSAKGTSPFLLTGMLVLAIFFSMGSRVIFSPLMPALQEEMNFGLSAAGSLFLLVNVIYGVSMLLAGFISSRIGHGKTIVMSLSAIGLGLCATAIAPGLALLSVGMLLTGAGAGLYPPSGLAMINNCIDIRHRNSAFAFHEIGPNLALLLSPLIVLALQPVAGRQGILLIMGLLSFIAALIFLRWGATGGGYGAKPAVGTLAVILRHRGVLLGIVIISSAIAGMQGVYAILPAYLVSEYGLEPGYVNLVLALSRFTGVFLLLWAGGLMNRFGRRRMMNRILLFSACFTVLVGVVRGPLISVVVILQPALLAIIFPPLLSALAEVGDPEYQNLTYAVIITAGVGLGGGVAPAFLGFFADLDYGWIGFTAIAVWMLMAVFFLWRTPSFGRDTLPPAG